MLNWDFHVPVWKSTVPAFFPSLPPVLFLSSSFLPPSLSLRMLFFPLWMCLSGPYIEWWIDSRASKAVGRLAAGSLETQYLWDVRCYGFWLSNWKDETVHWGTTGWNRFRDKDWLTFGHVKTEMPTRHPNGDNWAEWWTYKLKRLEERSVREMVSGSHWHTSGFSSHSWRDHFQNMQRTESTQHFKDLLKALKYIYASI